MEMTRKQRRLQLAEEERTHRSKMVKSKSRGWLVVGMTSLAMLGGVALSQADAQTVSASGPDHPVATTTDSMQSKQWSLRPESEIQAQIKQDTDKSTYEIQWGDTLSTIADSLNQQGITTSVSRLAEINKIANIDLIYAGDTLYINGSGNDATVTTKTTSGNTATYNLNPAKPAATTTNTTATQATAKPAATSSQNGSVGSTSATTNTTSTTAKPTVTTDKPATTTVVSQPTTTTPATKPDQGGISVDTNTSATGTDTTKPDTGDNGSTTTPTTKPDDGSTATKPEDGNSTTTTAPTNKPDSGEDTNANTNTDNGDGSTTTQPAATTVTIKAVDENGNVIKTQTQAQHVGDKITVKADTTLTVNGVQYDLSDLATQTLVVGGEDVIQIGYTKHAEPVAKTGTITVIAKDTDGNVIKTQAMADSYNVGSTVAVSAPVISGYTLQDSASKNVSVVEGSNTVEFIFAKDAVHTPVNTDRQVTVNVDEDGKTLTSTTGYDKVSASEPVKTVQTAANGDTTTTYTTTVTYKKHVEAHTPVNTDKNVTVNVDEEGNTLTSTTGYDKVSTSNPEKSVQTAANGDTTTTYTTTVTYKKHVDTPTNTDKNVTLNVDEDGNALTSTDGYKQISASTPVKSVVTAANGDTTTTYTTTATWHKPVYSDKYVTLTLDTNGNAITDTTDYALVSRSLETSSTVSANGDTVTTHTTKTVWRKGGSVINVDENGNELSSTDGYELVSSSKQSSTITVNGQSQTIETTTNTWRKLAHTPTNTDKQVTVNVDEAGNTLTSTTGYTKVSTSDPVKSVATATNGDTTTTYTTTVKWHQIANTNKSVTVNKDEAGTVLTSTTGYTKVSTSDPVKSVQTAANGDTTTTMTTTVTWKKTPVAVDTSAVAARLTELVNDWRTQNGLSALAVDANLTAGAAVRAQQEADAINASGNIADADHYLPDGSKFNMEAHLQQYGSYTMAENLLVTNGSTTEEIAQNAFNQWKNSSGHNANMLGDYSDEGLAVVTLSNGQIFALQDFGFKAKNVFDSAHYNSADLSAVGMTKADVAQALVNIGLYDSNTIKNVYISDKIFKTLDDADGYMLNGNYDQVSKNVWMQPDAFGFQTLPVYKGSNIVGFVNVEEFNSDAATATAGWSDSAY